MSDETLQYAKTIATLTTDRDAWKARAETAELAVAAARNIIAAKDSQLAKAREALAGVLAIVSDSSGVAGYHLNGDVAQWGEFEEINFARVTLAEIQEKSDG